jgi:hypothetical protein
MVTIQKIGPLKLGIRRFEFPTRNRKEKEAADLEATSRMSRATRIMSRDWIPSIQDA